MTVTHNFPPPQPGMIAGRSAWTTWGHTTGSRYYKYGSPYDGTLTGHDEPENLAIHDAIAGLQRTVNAYGYRHPIFGPIPVSGLYGYRTKWGVQWFQSKNALADDGVFGPLTAKGMFVPLTLLYCGGAMGGVVVPAAHVLGVFDLESGWDPGAVSTWYKPANGPDRGLGQINKNSHPDITDAQAFDPMFSIPYAIWRLHEARLQFAGKGPDLQTACSIAQHNSPADALKWYQTGAAPDQQISDYVAGVIERGERLIAA